MNDERKKRAWPWIVAVLIGLPVLYVASFGPACALVEHHVLAPSILKTGIFRPCLYVSTNAPLPIQKVAWAWAEICGGEYALFDAAMVDPSEEP